MAYLYYQADWIINKEGQQYIPEMFDVAFALNAALYLERKQNDEGYHVLKLVIRVETKEILDVFVKDIAAKIGLTEWTLVTKADFLGEAVHPHSLAGTVQGMFFDILDECAMYNQDLIMKNKLKNI